MTFRGCASQKCSNHIYRKYLIFLRIMLEKFPQYRYFTRQNALFQKVFLQLLSRFLVDTLPVFVS